MSGRRLAPRVLVPALVAAVLVIAPFQQAATALVAVPSTEASSPAVVSLGPGGLDVVSLSGTHVLQQAKLPGGNWRRPIDRGSGAASQPVAVSWGPGRLDVFVRGSDNTLRHRWQSGGTWSGWVSLGGVLSSAPAAASGGPGQLDVFVRGSNGSLYQKTFSAGAWSGWKGLGGVLSSSPAVTATAAGLHVVVRTTGDRVARRFYSPSTGWSGWTDLGGVLTSQPAISSPGSGHLDVVGRGTGGRMYLKRLTPGTGWTGWLAVGTNTFTSGPAMTAIGDDVVLAARGSNGFVYTTTRTSPGAAWSSWQMVDQYRPFRRLATWVDTLDYAALDPAIAVPDMRARGVRTLFLSTARFNSTSDFFNETEMAQWLDTAHAAGIAVIGWYVPAYGDMTRDVRRTVAIGNYVSPNGQRFDAVGVDIERFGSSGELDRATFNARVVPHLQQVRAGTSAVIGAIVPSPFTTDPGNNWEGFPWEGIGPNSEVVVPMALWSFRSGFSAAQVEAWVIDQVDRTQALTGRRVHVEGGVIGEGSTPVTSDRVQAFVDAVIGAGAIGGSQYDYATMNGPGEPTSLWSDLAGLNTL